ncbi:MAG: CopD family protein [Amphritea sp.]
MAFMLAVHLLAAVVWVGGMFFAYQCLRTVAAQVLEPPLRLQVWCGVLRRFFPWVWLAIATLLISGHGMIALYGGMAAVGAHVHVMMLLGYLMVALYAYLFFVPFRELKAAVVGQSWPDGAKSLNQIRQIVAINLALGLLVVVLASAGRALF